jgi:hypothetical protein
MLSAKEFCHGVHCESSVAKLQFWCQRIGIMGLLLDETAIDEETGHSTGYYLTKYGQKTKWRILFLNV